MAPRLRELLEELDLFRERQDRIEYLLALAGEYVRPGPDEVPRNSSHRVSACESEVYVASLPVGHGRRFRIAVDNPQGVSAMALAVMLEQGLSGRPPSEVEQTPDDLALTVFGRELSMGKSAGLREMVRMVKLEARKAS